VKYEEQFEIGAPIERLYREINDLSRIAELVDEVRGVTVISDTESRWQVQAQTKVLGHTFQRAMELDARILERRPPTSITFTVSGPEVSLNGQFELEELAPDRTRCRARVDVNLSGGLAPLAALLARGPLERFTGRVLDNVHRKLESAAAST
jgi:carbon monoxide dehydrogenase subunit G